MRIIPTGTLLPGQGDDFGLWTTLPTQATERPGSFRRPGDVRPRPASGRGLTGLGSFSGPKGAWYQCAQRAMNVWGMTPPVKEDGLWGPDSQSAYEGVQDYYGQSLSLPEAVAAMNAEMLGLGVEMDDCGEPYTDPAWKAPVVARKHTAQAPAKVAAKGRIADPADKTAGQAMELNLGDAFGRAFDFVRSNLLLVGLASGGLYLATRKKGKAKRR